MASAQGTVDSTSNDSKENFLDDLLEQMQRIDLKSDSDRDIIIPEWSMACESPFLWNSEELRSYGAKKTIEDTILELEELKIEEPGFSVQRFISLLRLVLEYCIKDELEMSWENMKTVEKLLEREASTNNPLYHEVKLSLGHVISSTKVHLLALTGEEEEAKKIAKDIIPIKIMENRDQAALYAMKAQFFMYMYENGDAVSVALTRKALDLEPDNDEFKYLLAKMLRRQRRSDDLHSLDIPKEEVILLEDAVKKTRNPKYLVFLAQVYRECSAHAYFQYKDTPNFFKSDLNRTIKDMQHKALNYYKESYELSLDSPENLRRIGYGLMKFPRYMADYNFALKCLLQSLELSENPLILHVLGTFYHRYGKNNVKALECFEKVFKLKSHYGLIDMIKLKYLMNKEYDPCEDFESGLKWEKRKKDRIALLIQIGGFYLINKRDLFKSIDYFNQILAESKDSPLMKDFRSLFFYMRDPINLYEYIVNEALLLLQKAGSSTHLDIAISDDEEGNISNIGRLKEFLDRVNEIYPELMEITPDPFLITKLHPDSHNVGI